MTKDNFIAILKKYYPHTQAKLDDGQNLPEILKDAIVHIWVYMPIYNAANNSDMKEIRFQQQRLDKKGSFDFS